MRKGHQPVFTVSSRLSEPPSFKTSGQLPTAAQKFLRCRSALGTSLTHKVAKSFSWVVCGVQYSCSDIQPELRYFSPPCSVSVRRSECTAGRGSDSHKIQAGMRYETRGALRAHTASVLASLDHHLWDKIVASLSLEDSELWQQHAGGARACPDCHSHPTNPPEHMMHACSARAPSLALGKCPCIARHKRYAAIARSNRD